MPSGVAREQIAIADADLAGAHRQRAALDQVVAAAKRHGKRVMTTIGNNLDPAYGRSVAKRGVQMIVLGTDGHLFLDACRRMNSVKSV
jgi:nucleotide-binding universal stress UspA family protein